MSTHEPKKRRNHLIIGSFAVLLIGVAIVFWPRDRPEPSSEKSKVSAATEPRPTPHTRRKKRMHKKEDLAMPPRYPERPEPEVRKRPLIEEVTLDKTTACPGESVVARMKQRNDVVRPVQYSVPGRAHGNPVTVGFDAPGEHTVHVVASDGVGGLDFAEATLTVLEPDALECASKPQLAVMAHISNTEADSAVIRVRSDLGENVRYTYDFGDGETTESMLQTLTHSYRLREQREPTSTFLVRVSATDEQGREVVGRASVAFRNVHWLSNVVGSPMVPVSYERFADRRGSSYETEVTFKNIEDAPIEFSKVSITKDTCRDEEHATTRHSVDEVFDGLSRLSRNGTHTATLSLPAELVADACRVVVEIEGDTVPARAGTPIGPDLPRTFDTTRAQIAMEIAPPPKDDALPHAAPVAVTEKGMVERLERAQELLGPDHPITPDDLARLESQGLL